MNEDKMQSLEERKIDQTDAEFDKMLIKFYDAMIEAATKVKRHLIETYKATEDQLQDLVRSIEDCENTRRRLVSKEHEVSFK